MSITSALEEGLLTLVMVASSLCIIGVYEVVLSHISELHSPLGLEYIYDSTEGSRTVHCPLALLVPGTTKHVFIWIYSIHAFYSEYYYFDSTFYTLE